MELFTVNRYAEESVEISEKREEEILQSILTKVAKRKRNHEYDTTDNLESQTTSDHHVAEEAVMEADADATPTLQSSDTNREDISDEKGTFEVLGEDTKFAKKAKVDVVLPSWLAHPTVISLDLNKHDMDSVNKSTALDELPYLTDHVRCALKEMSIDQLFPVQAAVIPWILEAHSKPTPFRPRDICVSSPTGSGKTLAFAIPIVQLLANRVQCRVRALVVLPVVELAAQVYKVFKKLCEKTELKVCLLSKKVPFPAEQDKLVEFHRGQYYSKADIVITTPGRFVEHIHATKGFCLKSLKFLVIDEADRIMSAVFQNWLYHLNSQVQDTSNQLLAGRPSPLCYYELLHYASKQPHKLLFSATLSQDPEKLQSLHLFHPKLFTSVSSKVSPDQTVQLPASESMASDLPTPEAGGNFVGKYTTPAELVEKFCITEIRVKPLTLYSLVKGNGWKKFLCFVNSAESAERLAFVLRKLLKDLNVRFLSSAQSAQNRSKILNNFASGKLHGLICTDALARGIDIPNVDIVISYDAPRHVKTYIHRVGRTARAGRPGTSVALLTQDELDSLKKSLAEVGRTLTEEITASTAMEQDMASDYTKALYDLRLQLEKDKRNTLLLKQRLKDSANVSKDPDSMTLMEKLQVQLREGMLQQAQGAQKLKKMRKKNKL